MFSSISTFKTVFCFGYSLLITCCLCHLFYYCMRSPPSSQISLAYKAPPPSLLLSHLTDLLTIGKVSNWVNRLPSEPSPILSGSHHILSCFPPSFRVSLTAYATAACCLCEHTQSVFSLTLSHLSPGFIKLGQFSARPPFSLLPTFQPSSCLFEQEDPSIALLASDLDYYYLICKHECRCHSV